MSCLMITREERVLRLTLNNPERSNTLDESTCNELVGALGEAAEDRSVGCVLLDARGQVFCGGFALEACGIHEELFTFGARYPKPLVAAVQGAALGAGVGLIANCHVVLAAQGVQFGLTDIRVGNWPFAIHRALTLAIGERRTVELSMTGRVFGIGDALQYGLVHEVTPAFELEDRATATARQLASASQETLRRGLEFVQESRALNSEAAEQLARQYLETTLRSADFREGVQALKEKRRPEWPSLL